MSNHDIAQSSLLRALEMSDPAKLPTERLAGYAYALDCCRYAATMSGDAFHCRIATLCDQKSAKLRKLTKGAGGNKEKLVDPDAAAFPGSDYSQLTETQLIALHSMVRRISDSRHRKKMETSTRIHQWRIVDALFRHDETSPIAHLLLLAECLEVANHSVILGLPYKIGERLKPFVPSNYSSDEALVKHIRQLSKQRTYLSREALIDIADYVQTEIVEPGHTADHLTVVAAILSTGMPSFSYPGMTKALEKATAQLEKAGTKTRMELASTYYILWTKTLKQSYLNRFQTTLRHCYRTLADGRQYPGLGIDSRDPRSLSAALSFLDGHRSSLWTLDTHYDLDKVVHKYDDILTNVYHD